MAIRGLTLAFAALTALAFAADAQAQPATDQPQETYEFEGTIGALPVGGSVSIAGGTTFVRGHYFYASQLKDIPLTGHEDGTSLTMTEPGGGVFKLTLQGNGGKGGDGTSYETSVALVGTWSGGGRTLPARLGFSTTYGGGPPSPWYGEMTSESDAAFEARAQHFLKAVMAGDKQAAASLVSYPLSVNGHPSLTLRNEAALIAAWPRVFTPKLLAELKTALPHEMFVREERAMVSNGAVWFDAKGASVINLP